MFNQRSSSRGGVISTSDFPSGSSIYKSVWLFDIFINMKQTTVRLPSIRLIQYGRGSSPNTTRIANMAGVMINRVVAEPRQIHHICLEESPPWSVQRPQPYILSTSHFTLSSTNVCRSRDSFLVPQTWYHHYFSSYRSTIISFVWYLAKQLCKGHNYNIEENAVKYTRGAIQYGFIFRLLFHLINFIIV